MKGFPLELSNPLASCLTASGAAGLYGEDVVLVIEILDGTKVPVWIALEVGVPALKLDLLLDWANAAIDEVDGVFDNAEDCEGGTNVGT